jgi:D-alanyl-D-alanine carboxypeptidase/D-alanyl-D-alanine-endopeptidase (penicillin-binding protein 4)
MVDRRDPPDRRSRRRRGRGRRVRVALRVVGCLLIVAALVTAVGVVVDATEPANAARSPKPTINRSIATPLWSARRMPQVVAAAAAKQHFPRVIAGFAAPGRCVAVDGPDGRLARVAAATPLAPASTLKLLTGAAALRVRGADYVFTTRVVATDPVADGVLRGDLDLVGGGDPTLSTAALDDLASAVAKTGIRRIEGAIVADDSRYDTTRYLPSLEPGERFEIGPLGALTVDHGLTSSGAAASDPALLTAQSFDDLLANHGVVVAGAARRGTAPAGARTVASLRSAPVAAIVEGMLTASDNYTAEMLVREVGFAVSHTGSTEAGLRDMIATVARLGVPTAGVSIVDGSGLSHRDRVTCAALLAAVELGERPGLEALRTGLAVAGRTGTLALRFVGDPLAGRLRAKTGRVDGVVGLAGVVSTPAGVVRFAFVANGDFSVTGGEELQSRIAHLVAGYPSIPATELLVPQPSGSAGVVPARETAPPD